MSDYFQTRRLRQLVERSVSVGRSSVRLTYGIHDLQAEIAGLTVAETQVAFRDILNIDEGTEALINGRQVDRTTRLRAGDRLELVREGGTKGSGSLATEMLAVLKDMDRRMAVMARNLETIELFIARPQLADMLTKGEYSVNEVARLTGPYGVRKSAPYTVRLACLDGRIPEAKRNESGHYRIPREAVLRILKDGIPPERR